MVNIGFIGLDTSHVEAFARLLMRADDPNHVAGGRVVAAYAGGSADFPLSINRVGGYTDKLRDQYGVRIEPSPEAVAERVDVVFITSVDGRVHREMFERVITFGKPVFIDKPFATTAADASAIVRRAEEAGVAVMSCSSLRYAEGLVEVLGKVKPLGIDVFGPMALEPTQPGYFWYGIHGLDMIVRALGPGCRRVRVIANEQCDVLSGEWGDGRVATFRGVRGAGKAFGATVHDANGPHFVDGSAGRPPYAGMLAAILRALPAGRSDVSADEMLEVIRIAESGNVSRETGAEVRLDAVGPSGR